MNTAAGTIHLISTLYCLTSIHISTGVTAMILPCFQYTHQSNEMCKIIGQEVIIFFHHSKSLYWFYVSPPKKSHYHFLDGTLRVSSLGLSLVLQVLILMFCFLDWKLWSCKACLQVEIDSEIVCKLLTSQSVEMKCMQQLRE